LDDGTVGYQVDKITEKIAEEASQFVNSESFINDNSWWLNWAYTNGTMAEKDYDDVPNFKRILKTIAESEKISVEEVEREMQRAIDVGFDNPDKDIQNEWKKISFKGDRPTVQEVIEALSKQAKNI